jgi:hypothetical protein
MVWVTAIGLAAALFASCGGGDDSIAGAGGNKITTTGSNVVSAVVDAGPANSVNTLFVSVTICAPGSTTNCQTVDGIQVDTGSSGLRLLASALTVSLPTTSDGNGNTYVECTQYVDGYAWGPLATADVTIGGESASNVPVQVIGSTNFATVPDACSSTGAAEDTVATFGANGILGVSVFAQDCGAACVGSTGEPNPLYYTCVTADTTQCTPTALPLASQVPNPVTLFATDNNGVIIELPAVSATGASSVTGSLVFGVDTESNNSSSGATVLTLDADTGNLTTKFDGQTDTASFFDSGSNGLYFNDSSLTTCTDNVQFYCPASTTSLSAMIVGQNNVSVPVDFSVANTDDLGAGDASLVAFSNLAGTYSTSNTFDWGLPFFYGRNVYTVFENASTAAGAGPYVAF